MKSRGLSEGLPLTSVIVCTRDGQERLSRTLESVLGQDTGRFEVIVVDDGSEPAVDLPDGSIVPLEVEPRLIRTEPLGVGAARAAGLEAARGELVAFCDDDDDWRAEHLRELREYLLEHPDVALVYGDSEWLCPDGSVEVPYSFDYDADRLAGDNYIFPSDVMFWAEAARSAGGFDPAQAAYEDWDLWLRMSRRYKLRHVRRVLSRTHWRPGCVSATERWGPAWERVFDAHQRRMRRGLRRRRVPFDSRTWCDGRRQLIWHSVLDRIGSRTGYGAAGRNLLRALESVGVEILIPAEAPFGVQPADDAFDHLFVPGVKRDKLAFFYGHPIAPHRLGCELTAVYHMWESTRVPERSVRDINAGACMLFVPCQQNAISYLESGVRVPVRVLHHGVDPLAFPELRRPRRDSFTFGTFGDLHVRKGGDVLVRAFCDEFAAGEDVRLILKAFDEKRCPDAVRDPRITVLAGYSDQPELLALLTDMDAFVLPSRGEGFGLCALEAMATGLPVIATNWGGPVEYLDPADSFPLAYQLVDAGGAESFGVRYHGRWAEPSYEHLRSLMRWLYEHPDVAAEKGRLAAARVREHWSWERPARQLCADLDEIAAQCSQAA